MKEEKLKKIVSAITVAGVLFAVFLVLVIIYQLIAMSVMKKRKQELINQINYYYSVIEKTEDEIEKNSAYWYIEQKAYEYGLMYGDDEKFDGK